MPDDTDNKSKKKKYIWYAVGVIVGIGAYLWYRNYQANAANAAQGAALAAEPSGAMGATTDLSGGSNPLTVAVSTLQQWMSEVQTWAPSALNADPALVQNALQAYSSGTCLTQAEYAIVDKALGQFGAPPDAPFQGLVLCPNQGNPPPTSPPPTSGPPTPPASTLSFFKLIENPTITQGLIAQGYNIFRFGNSQYYFPTQTNRTPGHSMALQWIPNPSIMNELKAAGYTIYQFGNADFYNPGQHVA